MRRRILVLYHLVCVVLADTPPPPPNPEEALFGAHEPTSFEVHLAEHGIGGQALLDRLAHWAAREEEEEEEEDSYYDLHAEHRAGFFSTTATPDDAGRAHEKE
ncbi:MAG: hypothetical protein CMQ41_14150 [Gammaproteobacteria bacterium]|nr:hypothetical protein [Gammaproteobacteria bacterium]